MARRSRAAVKGWTMAQQRSTQQPQRSSRAINTEGGLMLLLENEPEVAEVAGQQQQQQQQGV
eukprot:1159126-Pelagomonas_calceolata.AAC.13